MFDPYHKWLGIPPKDQPPNHYRLLALEPHEPDPEVIDAAANRQTAYVERQATGEHATVAHDLLAELRAARVCLLDATKKAAYDAELKIGLSQFSGGLSQFSSDENGTVPLAKSRFDPYHKWLGILLKDQPPNHYRLLGLELFESDPEVLAAAADRQMAYVQQRAVGRHAAESQRLLNELSAARVCLLDPEKKAAYDAKLRGLSQFPRGQSQFSSDENGTVPLPARRPSPSPKVKKKPSRPPVAPPPSPPPPVRTGIEQLFAEEQEALLQRAQEAQSEQKGAGQRTDATLQGVKPVPSLIIGNWQIRGEWLVRKYMALSVLVLAIAVLAGSMVVYRQLTTAKPFRGGPPEWKPAVYNLEIDPPSATLTVKDNLGVVTGMGKRRDVRVDHPPSNDSIVIEVACSGYNSWEKSFTPAPGETVDVQVELEPKPTIYNVEISPPDATLSIRDSRGTITGSGSKREIRVDHPLSARNMAVVATCPGYETREQSLQTKPGETANLLIQLEPEPAIYRVHVEPPAATVTVKGNLGVITGSGGQRQIRFDHPPLSQDVVIEAVCPGYKPWQQLLKPKPGETAKVQVRLEKLADALAVNTGRPSASSTRDVFLTLRGHTRRVTCLTLRGHTRPVTCVQFSPNGKRIASGSWDRTIKIWNVSTGQQVLSIDADVNVKNVVFSPDGQWISSVSSSVSSLLSVSRAGVEVWDARTGKQIRRFTFTGYSDVFNSSAFSPDGQRIATGSWDGPVEVWDARTGEKILTFNGHPHYRYPNHVTGVAFSPDGQRVASCAGGVVKVWDAGTGKQIRTFKKVRDIWVSVSIAFSPDARRIATGCGHDEVNLWDVRSGKRIWTASATRTAGYDLGVPSLGFSPDGRWIACDTMDGLKIWDASTRRELVTLSDSPNVVTSVAFSPDGRRIACGTQLSIIEIWDLPP